MRKGLFFGMFALVFTAAIMCFTGCDLPGPAEDTYDIEVGTVDVNTKNEAQALIAGTSNIQYSDIKLVKNYLYRWTEEEDYAVSRNVSEASLKDLLRTKGATEEMLNDIFSTIDKIGNNILYFEHAESEDLVVWMYIEK